MKLAYVNGDCGYYTTGNTFETYSVTDAGITVLIEFTYNEGIANVKTDNELACQLPGILGAAHLIACVNITILKYFDEDNCFYHEGFLDEDGNSIERELEVLAI